MSHMTQRATIVHSQLTKKKEYLFREVGVFDEWLWETNKVGVGEIKVAPVYVKKI